MADTSPALPTSPLAEVRLEVHQGSSRPISYDVAEAGFLVGSVPGCDLRLPGTDLPPVLCLISRRLDGAGIRKLSPSANLQVNEHPCTGSLLRHGDRLKIGSVDLLVSIKTRALPDDAVRQTAELDERAGQLEAKQRLLEQQAHELDVERVSWHRRREDIEQRIEQAELKEQQYRDRETRIDELERAATIRAEEQRLQQTELDRERANLQQKHAEIEEVRGELANVRKQLFERYQTRRVQLLSMQEAVKTAAQKVQEQKHEVERETRELSLRRQEDQNRRADLEHRLTEFHQERVRLQEERNELELRLNNCTSRESQLAEDRQKFSADHAQYLQDLARLDRGRAEFEDREKQLEAAERDMEERKRKLERDLRDQEEQAKQLDDWHVQLCAQGDVLARQKAESEATRAELDRRQGELSAQLERLESLVREQHDCEQRLAEEKHRQEQLEADLSRRHRDIERAQAELSESIRTLEDKVRRDAERETLLQEKERQFAHEQEQLTARAKLLDEVAARQSEEAGEIRRQTAYVAEQQQQLAVDRQALRERETALAQAERTREALQEQLRRRAEDLVERHRAAEEQTQRLAQAAEELERRQAEAAALSQELADRTAQLEQSGADLRDREESLRVEVEKLFEVKRLQDQEKQYLADARRQWENDRQETAKAMVRSRAELSEARDEALHLQRQIPDLELRAVAAAERLAGAREQLRGHLAELHAFARLTHDDLETARTRIQAENERVRDQADSLNRSRDEHREAVAAFRQQLLDWQNRVAEMKLALAQGAGRTTHRPAPAKPQVPARPEPTHLQETRTWLRTRIHDLARGREIPAADKITFPADADSADRQLATLLHTSGLAEPGMLSWLLTEVQRQRKSLRQLLLADGRITLYQMALIEAGNLEGLMLGPVRVFDRIRSSPHETLFRVFDPRHNHTAILRLLAETDAQNPERADEYRRRFGFAATLQSPHLPAVFEVLDIQGRPAVLEEYVVGLPAADWPALTGMPGAWHRLLWQATLALQAGHQCGLVHGHLQPSHLLLTAEGTLKLRGLPEPSWLVPGQAGTASAMDDLAALGRIAQDWIGPRNKLSRTRLVKSMTALIDGLCADECSPESAAALAAELERLQAEVPAQDAGWMQVLAQVQADLAGDVAVRKTA